MSTPGFQPIDVIDDEEARRYCSRLMRRAHADYLAAGNVGDPYLVGAIKAAFCRLHPKGHGGDSCPKVRGFANLHRKDGAKDWHGADFAVTVVVKEGEQVAVKTALFQAKMVKDRGLVDLEEDHVNDLIKYSPSRAFGFAFDPETGKAYILNPDRLAAKSQLQHDWIEIEEWVPAWLRCEVGAKSAFGQTGSVEFDLLERFSNDEDWLEAVRLLGFASDQFRRRGSRSSSGVRNYTVIEIKPVWDRS